MATPIQFQQKKADPKQELQRRLEAAPLQHAEAVLVAFDLLEEAHRQGVLDMLHGAVGSKDFILGKLAEFAKEPMSTQALRNILALGALLGSIDPDLLQQIANPTSPEPPSFWQIFKTMRSLESRRGLAIVAGLLAALGGGLKTGQSDGKN